MHWAAMAEGHWIYLLVKAWTEEVNIEAGPTFSQLKYLLSETRQTILHGMEKGNTLAS